MISFPLPFSYSSSCQKHHLLPNKSELNFQLLFEFTNKLQEIFRTGLQIARLVEAGQATQLHNTQAE